MDLGDDDGDDDGDGDGDGDDDGDGDGENAFGFVLTSRVCLNKKFMNITWDP